MHRLKPYDIFSNCPIQAVVGRLGNVLAGKLGKTVHRKIQRLVLRLGTLEVVASKSLFEN